jgi:hypothetical protein
VLLEVMLGMGVEMRGVKERLGGDAADVEAGATESAARFDAGSLERAQTH